MITPIVTPQLLSQFTLEVTLQPLSALRSSPLNKVSKAPLTPTQLVYTWLAPTAFSTCPSVDTSTDMVFPFIHLNWHYFLSGVPLHLTLSAQFITFQKPVSTFTSTLLSAYTETLISLRTFSLTLTSFGISNVSTADFQCQISNVYFFCIF